MTFQSLDLHPSDKLEVSSLNGAAKVVFFSARFAPSKKFFRSLSFSFELPRVNYYYDYDDDFRRKLASSGKARARLLFKKSWPSRATD